MKAYPFFGLLCVGASGLCAFSRLGVTAPLGPLPPELLRKSVRISERENCNPPLTSPNGLLKIQKSPRQFSDPKSARPSRGSRCLVTDRHRQMELTESFPSTHQPEGSKAFQAVTSDGHSQKKEQNFLPNLSIATALLRYLPSDELIALGPHQQSAVTELGHYAEDASSELLNSPELSAAEIRRKKALIASEADGYLRASIGIQAFNQLSFIASAKANAAKQESLQ